MIAGMSVALKARKDGKDLGESDSHPRRTSPKWVLMLKDVKDPRQAQA